MTQNPPINRPAYTLVELLIAVFIISVLIGLLLPAVQAAREAARRAACSSNLNQLAVALFQFESHSERLPPGSINPTGPIRSEPKGQHVSWIVQILPMIEELRIYARFDQEAGAYAAANQPLQKHVLPVLQCPSQSASTTMDPPIVWPLTNYAGCHNDIEAPINFDNNGVLFLNSRLQISGIDDGTSRTIMLGEFLPEPNLLGWASGTRATLRNTGGAPNGAMGPVPPNRPIEYQVGNFGSSHTGGCQFAMADSSLRFMSQSIDITVFRQLGHRRDGEMSTWMD